MNAVGIDVSKGKSTVTIRRPADEIVMPPCDFPHTQSGINGLIAQLKCLDGESKVCMEHSADTMNWSPLGFPMPDSSSAQSTPSLSGILGLAPCGHPRQTRRMPKKIARYTLDHWANLMQYNRIDELRNQLKTMNRQFGFYMDQKTAMKNNLIALLDQTYPDANRFFESPARSDGLQKWVDFVYTYWHVDCVRGKSLQTFTEHYQNWCRRKGYNFSAGKAETVYHASSDLIPVFPRDDTTMTLIRQAVTMLNTASGAVESLRMKMDQTAATLPEYPVVMAMDGVGPTLGPQLMAEISNVTRFTHHGTLTAFAGVDPGANQSGDTSRKAFAQQRKARRTCAEHSS